MAMWPEGYVCVHAMMVMFKWLVADGAWWFSVTTVIDMILRDVNAQFGRRDAVCRLARAGTVGSAA
jgi:hypothetical protein